VGTFFYFQDTVCGSPRGEEPETWLCKAFLAWFTRPMARGSTRIASTSGARTEGAGLRICGGAPLKKGYPFKLSRREITELEAAKRTGWTAIKRPGNGPPSASCMHATRDGKKQSQQTPASLTSSPGASDARGPSAETSVSIHFRFTCSPSLQVCPCPLSHFSNGAVHSKQRRRGTTPQFVVNQKSTCPFAG